MAAEMRVMASRKEFETGESLIMGLVHLADMALSHELAGWRTRLISGWADAPAPL
jgi:hypothetical protein